MTKKIIAFDLDDTLAITKSPISDRMGAILTQLLEKYDVCIISGGKFEQFEQQVVERLEAPAHLLNKLHLMPTCGTRYYRYDELKSEWAIQYSEDLSQDERAQIIDVVEKSAHELGLWATDTYGDIIEDRGSQISYSALGQQAPAEAKYKWRDEHSEDREELRALIESRIPDFEVRAGGSTTIDITRIGIDKAYGMQKLVETLDIDKDEILFIGDKLEEGGNDYPVKEMGIDTIAVEKWEDTAYVLEGILGVTS